MSKETITHESGITYDVIQVGDKVRSFDFPGWSETRQKPWGLDLDGERACYVEGVVEAVGEDRLEGCPRYRIRATRRVAGGQEKIADATGSLVHVYPPVNGTPTLFGGVCFGVVKIEE